VQILSERGLTGKAGRGMVGVTKGDTDMTIYELIKWHIENAKPMTRKERAVANYQAIKGERAPDDLNESWADRA
jgi:hypothetical protein